MYVNGNPIKYKDPSGNFICEYEKFCTSAGGNNNVGSAAGIDEQTLQDGANVPGVAGRNDLGDQLSTQIGIDLWNEYGADLTKEQLISAILRNQYLYLQLQEKSAKDDSLEDFVVVIQAQEYNGR